MPRLAFTEVDADAFVDDTPVYVKQSGARPSLLKKVEAVRQEGSVRKIKQDRGFGFIAGDDGQDHFFHWSGMEKTTKNFRELEVQDRVSFVAITGDKGPRAICIRVIPLD